MRQSTYVRLPRWVPVLLFSLSAVSVVTFLGWLWHGWPSRTMREFAGLLVDGKLDDVNAMIPSGPQWLLVRREGYSRGHWLLATDDEMPYFLSPEDRQHGFRFDGMRRVPRMLPDWIRGRAAFDVHKIRFTAERGAVFVGYNELDEPIVDWPGCKPNPKEIVRLLTEASADEDPPH